MNKELVTIGKILKPHGVKGILRVLPLSDFYERVKLLDNVLVSHHNDTISMDIEETAFHGNYWLVKFKSIDDRDQARNLTGRFLKIPFEDRLKLPEGSFYFDQILDLEVYDLTGKRLGVVVDIIETGANDIYTVKTDDEGLPPEILIPALKKVIKEIDIDKGSMLVDLPEGLI